MTPPTLDLTQTLTQEERQLEQKLIHRWMKLEPQDLVTVSHIKRFIERYEADPDFRTNIVTEPEATVTQHNLKIPPQEIRWLWDKNFVDEQIAQGKSLPESIQLFLNYKDANHQWMYRWRDRTLDSDLRFQAWRARQIARGDSEIRKSHNNHILHAPVAFELTKGCSVGCWFCGISAPRFSDIFRYTAENAQLWQETLEIVREITGSAAGSGFCYWATDPMDNPDYENFIDDFYRVLGVFPQTTTAQPLRDAQRTRSLLQHTEAKSFIQNRFSILSLKTLDALYAEFSPEELLHVGLALQNKESLLNKAISGRTLARNKQQTDDNLPQSTIACVSGFLFNMVERSVKLISPTQANERWSNGYRVYAEGTFTNAADLKILLEKMIAEHMPLAVRADDLVRFRRDLKHENLVNGFQLSSPFLTLKFRRPYMRELGEMIVSGKYTAATIADSLSSLGVSPEDTFYALNVLFKRGVLDDEPN
jgi:radical SAM family RiPP maturation amino acid epimerase